MPSYKKSTYLLILFFIIIGSVTLFRSDNSFEILKNSSYLGKVIEIEKKNSSQTTGLFTGEECSGAGNRPFAVMLAGDPEARPLSGISQADMVIEMPVVVNNITRYLAIYQCVSPREIGSVRSARGPFIGLAKGYGVVFAHWGGERDALDTLHRGIIENIDALGNPYAAFWRKKAVPMPHDGFTSYENLFLAAKKLNYDVQSPLRTFFTFKKSSTIPSEWQNDSNSSNNLNKIITIGYPGIFNVSYQYKKERNAYLRFKGGTAEKDALTNDQIYVKNIVVMRAAIYPTYSQYDNVELDGKEGSLITFAGGREIKGIWRKKGFNEPLLFFDLEGKPLEFDRGNIWVQIVGLEQKVDVIKL